MRILAFAYACEPDKGSEPGAGWALARILAGFGETCVITRANNREAVEAALARVPERERLRFEYVDLPAWARFWKRGRIGIQPYYLLWQVAALRRARRLHRRAPFDVVWHLTLANAWLGSTAGLVGPPFIYGPIGGTMGVPARMIPELGVRGAGYEFVRGLARVAGRYANPLARIAWRQARLILVQNRETVGWLPERHRRRAAVFPNAFLDASAPPPRAASGRTAMYAGRLMPLKGLTLAIRAIQGLPGWRLLLFGQGSDEWRLRRLARRLGVDDRVEFRGHVPRDRLLRAMDEEADVFLFPSLRDDAGWAVVEAIGSGLPVACLGRGGPPLLAGDGVPVGRPAETSRALASKILELAVGNVPPLTALDVTSRRRQLVALLRAHGVAVPDAASISSHASAVPSR